mgnify:CR=1 FL=1
MIKESIIKYGDEPKSLTLPGLYSDFDGKVLYSTVRMNKPKTILDFAPREGKTLSLIVEALLKNKTKDITYIVCEKDIAYLNKIKSWTEQYKEEIKFIYIENIIDGLSIIKSYLFDFIFIDANHDFVLADWYIDNIFPLAIGYIHIHDVLYDLRGNGIEDIGFVKNPQSHPDIIDQNVLLSLYGSNMLLKAKEKYKLAAINIFEEDIIKNWYLSQKTYTIESTISLYRQIHGTVTEQDFIRSIYLIRNL